MARPLGAHSKNRLAMLASLKMRLGEDFDIVGMMGTQAKALYDNAELTKEPKDRLAAIDALDKLAGYVYPKLKAIEVDLSNEDGSLRPITQVRLIAVTAQSGASQGHPQAIEQDVTHGEFASGAELVAGLNAVDQIMRHGSMD